MKRLIAVLLGRIHPNLGRIRPNLGCETPDKAFRSAPRVLLTSLGEVVTAAGDGRAPPHRRFAGESVSANHLGTRRAQGRPCDAQLSQHVPRSDKYALRVASGVLHSDGRFLRSALVVNDTNCSVNDTDCSVNDTNLAVSDTDCSVNDTDCAVSDTNLAVNDTDLHFLPRGSVIPTRANPLRVVFHTQQQKRKKAIIMETINNAKLEKWSPAARALETFNTPQLPHHVLMGEAVDVARFFATHWKAQRGTADNITLPGFELAARGGTFTEAIGAEIMELREATQAAQTLYRLTVSSPEASGMDRADFIIAEIRVTLAFLFDDGVDSADDVRLERLASAHGYPKSQDAMATALEEYAVLAAQHREALKDLGGFDVGLIDEAVTLAASLQERSALRLAGEVRSSQRDALDLRNRLATLLYERMQRVRATARFIFRKNPDHIRRVTSSYRRQTRARQRATALQPLVAAPVAATQAPIATPALVASQAPVAPVATQTPVTPEPLPAGAST